MTDSETKELGVNIAEAVGGGYGDVWKFRGRYIVVKGSRASKKSKTTALRVIYNMMKYPLANVLCVRKTSNTLRNSCFSDLKWAVERLGVQQYFKFTSNPLKITYIPSGTCVLFRGMDDVLKITSISPDTGYLCWVWIEEAYEISSEEDFNKLDQSIRGQVPEGYFKQFILTLNPWSSKHWIKQRFFDCAPNPDILAKTTNYLCNEFLDAADKKLFEDMRKRNPAKYRVAGLGEWGISEGLIYENWSEIYFDWREILENPDVKGVYGLDFGYSTSYTAFIAALVNPVDKTIYIFDEIYERGLTNGRIASRIKNKGHDKELIVADYHEPKSIAELRDYGIWRVKGSRGGQDSVLYGIQMLQDYMIYVHPDCQNTIMELSNYKWATDSYGNTKDVPEKEYDHLMDALRYAVSYSKKYKLFKFE